MATGLRKRKLCIQICETTIKTDHSVRAEGLRKNFREKPWIYIYIYIYIYESKYRLLSDSVKVAEKT